MDFAAKVVRKFKFFNMPECLRYWYPYAHTRRNLEKAEKHNKLVFNRRALLSCLINCIVSLLLLKLGLFTADQGCTLFMIFALCISCSIGFRDWRIGHYGKYIGFIGYAYYTLDLILFLVK